MKKIPHDGLQVTGIILSLPGLGTVVRPPLIEAVFGKPLTYRFLGLLPEGWPAFAAWAAILAVGLALVSVTNPLKPEKDKRKAEPKNEPEDEPKDEPKAGK
ncbi:hypothetical protein SAMN02799624_05773 [Paenibacillus sp. UNC496MF]|uniref:hypothetical protein n=1 Tax=Paenibacillus sp. UNC496MF TaxID=1502753 RepID=UPI0008E6AA89|nr:hypothetical protein [Paenibacillus sp. UNC496MF]SFJ74160.1 hypothetical protein SAMN02799624_05773 [Paenibacillus sp. UNC496MF]